MVPVVLYLFLKKYMKKNWPSIKTRIRQFTIQRNLFLALGFLLLMLLKLLTLHAQQTELQYNIVRNGKTIGWTKIIRNNSNEHMSITMRSEVKARFIFQFIVSAIEQVNFEGDNLVYSSQFRELNGQVKEDKHMQLTPTGYQVFKEDDTQRLPFPALHFHTLCLYFQEPKDNSKVYSDAFQKELALERTSDGGYRMKLPDGNSCCYYYKNGICTKVKIDQRFYSAEMVLNQ